MASSNVMTLRIDPDAPLPGIRDPFNRLMVAAARAVRCLLVTADEALAASGPVDALCD
jgi:PIN domain nuclease of toxin-antitoxin system